MKYEIKEFSDGQVSAEIIQGGDIRVRIKGTSYADLFEAAAVKNAFDSVHAMIKPKATATLEIDCLIGQRSDRRFEKQVSFDLKIIAAFINSMKYDRVNIMHPHSDATCILIDNAYAIKPTEYIGRALADMDATVMVSPDAGAYKYTYDIAEKLQMELVAANKVRIDGEPAITVQGDVKGKDCLIVDDIADGGRTFVALAKKLKEQGASKVCLYVTHGMFHYGFNELKEHIDHIYCTNSYREIKDEYITQFKIE